MPEQSKEFRTFDPETNTRLFTDEYPTHFVSFDANQRTVFHREDTYFGFLFRPATIIKRTFGGLLMPAETFFAISGPFEISGAGRGFAVAREGHRAYDTLGGPVEAEGRLKYIDGCTDSLLVSPIRLGDPCLNHLHFPPNIKQTMHTHPSNRIGVVARGQGRCITPTGEIPLLPGVRFCIPRDSEHCFYTDDHTMDVIAWHPDSDYGPQDENHPMVNRTMVGGVFCFAVARHPD